MKQEQPRYLKRKPHDTFTEALRRADHETGYEPEELIPFHHYAELVVKHLREIELERIRV